MTLYRKYRPQTLDQLDSVSIRERLKQVLLSEYIPSAFLFAGPKGTGKTSTARIVAKILNCDKNSISKKKNVPQSKIINPCNKCDSCISITDGRHMDVIEIDAASNRGIEEVRELRDKIKLSPASGAYKIYIIDEVHMMTNEAFNALLKTLEEPPSHAFFIFATTEPEKLPSTILSRCTLFQFTKATNEEIIQCLKRVVEGEKIKVNEEVFLSIAESSDGSFRDATKVLEQAMSENSLTAESISKILGSRTISSEQFLLLFSKKDTQQLLVEIQKMNQNGTDFRFFVSMLLEYLHTTLLVQYGISKTTMTEQSKTLIEQNHILPLVKVFSKVYTDLKSSSRPGLPLEIAAVEWCEGK